ncbi:MAG: ABC transporter transmembrane domain-containing protein, partial [Candidatus Woesearchaeota archaeon]
MREKGGVKDFVHIVYSLMPGFKKLFLVFLLVILIGELIKFVPPYLVKLIVDGVVEGQGLNYLLMLLSLMFLALTVMTFINVYLLTKVSSSAAEQQKSMQEKSFAKLLKLPLSWHGKQNTGSIVSKLVKASNYIAQLIWFINSDIIPSLVQLVLTGAVLFWVDWRIGLIYAIFSPIILYLVNKQFKESQSFREEYHHEFEEATKIFAQGMYNIKTVKDYVQEKRESKEQVNHLERFKRAVKARTNTEFWKISLRDIITNLVRALSIGISIYLVTEGELTAGDLVFVFTIVEKAFLNLHRLGRIYSFMGDTYSALERAHAVQQTENTLKDEGEEKVEHSDLSFEKVSFSYD